MSSPCRRLHASPDSHGTKRSAPQGVASVPSGCFATGGSAAGFATGTGSYTAVARTRGVVRDNVLQPPPQGSVEAVLTATEMPRAILDVRSADASDPASAFLARPTPFRSVGALAMEQQFFPTNVSTAYDALIWIAQTSASREMR